MEPVTCAFDLVGKTLIFVHAKAAPSQKEWDAWLTRMAQDDYRSILVSTHGGGPTSLQRKQSSEVWNARAIYPKLAVVTESVAMRGIVTAFNWLGFGNIKAFGRSQMPQAFTFLETPTDEAIQVVARIMDLNTQLHRDMLASASTVRGTPP